MSGIQNLLLGGKPAAAAEDPDFEYVTLLLPGNGTNGAQNNTFLDSSTNNFTITRNGNTTQGTFSPFSRSDGYWSNYFDGTGDYIENTSNYLVASTTSTFTIEAWVFMTADPVNDANNIPAMISVNCGGGNDIINYLAFGPISSRKLRIRWFDGTSKNAEGSTTLALNTWYHVACSVSSNAIKMFVNGVEETLSGTTTLTNRSGDANGFALGQTYTYANYTGYISNARVLSGTALYTTGFTPSTAPLTAITNTVLLTCQSNRFRDASSNAYAITTAGNTSVQAFNPFEPSAAWSASTNGGSGYFDENGDYLDCGNGGTDYEFGSGDFTIEGWFYCLGKSLRHQMIMAKGSPTTNNAYDWRLYWGDTSNQRIWFDSNVFSVSSDTTAAEQLVLNAWNHIAVVRSGANGYLYLNGTRIDSVAASGTMNNSYTNVYVGAGNVGSAGQTYYNGYANGIRLLKGTAQYTGSTYTVPTSPFTAITNTELLLNFTNAGIYDAAAMNNLETVGNAQISTAQSKFGGSSISFDGTGDYLTSNSASANLYAFGSGNFTIEFWLRLNSTAAFQIIYDSRPTSGSGAQPTIYMNGSTITYYTNAGDRITGSTLSTNTWYHIALARSGTSTKLFVDGTQVGTTYTDSTVYTNSSNRPWIGADSFSLVNYLNGYINDLRVTNGVARYTANFTAPTAAFPLF